MRKYNDTVQYSINIFDIIICPQFIFEFLIQFQKDLCMPDVVIFSAFFTPAL